MVYTENKSTMKENSTRDSEKYIERKFNERVKALKGISFKFVPQFVSGIPDRIALIPTGIMFFAEIKSKGFRPSKLQLVWKAKLKKIGFEWYLIDSMESLNEVFKKYE